jgi:glucosamine--fructose-6-phosphate aminotransferase (isomerizing)
MNKGQSPVEAVKAALPLLRGAFALAFVFAGEDDLMIGARRGAPLAIGHGHGEMYLGSDALALASLTDEITYLDDGDWVVMHRSGVQIHDDQGQLVNRSMTRVSASTFDFDKRNYRDFMIKEIHEQPEVVARTLSQYLDAVNECVTLPANLPFDFASLDRVCISACGTACYAGQVGKYWLERYANLSVEVDIASEFRYRDVPLIEGGLSIFVSQSGETADTLACLRHARQRGQHVLSIVNVQGSTIARESDVILATLAGREIGVASTKAFTCQLAVLACLAIAAGRARNVLSRDDERKLVRALIEVPRYMNQALSREAEIEQLALGLADRRDVLYLGRGTSFPIALEGALKLKEISYIHAEGYAAGELKHGPIALIDETVPVVVVAPYDAVFEKTLSNMQEVAARGGHIMLVTDANGAREAMMPNLVTIEMPEVPAIVSPLVYAVPMQLLAYHTAVHLGTDVDQPRNLAKSVTVE